MLTNDTLHRHLEHERRREEVSGLRPSSPSPTTINAAEPDKVEALIEDIEGWGDFQLQNNFSKAAKFLRSFGFSQEAIAEILEDVPHELRVHRAYLEAVRIQQQHATDGVEEKPRPEDGYEVKTVTFGNTAVVPPSTPANAEEPAKDSLSSESGLQRTVVCDDEYEEVPFNPAREIPQTPEKALEPSPIAPPPSSPPPVKVRKSKLPEDVVTICNAHFPHDRSGTIRQSHLTNWVQDIKTLPKYSAFDVFGELNGEMVDLVAYVNRVGHSCYVGNKYNPKSTRRKLTWDTETLGRLPVKGEKFNLRVISINPREA